MMEFDLKRLAARKLILVAHRGVWGGNIPCNTSAAYETALRQGADMIEIDVDRSLDGHLFVFHPGMEPAHLNREISIREMTDAQIKKLRYVNIDNVETQFGVEELSQVLDRFRGRCYINIDKFCDNPEEIAAAVRERGMTGQILVKTAPEEKNLELIERYCPDMQYMAMVKTPEEIERVGERRLNYIGNEVLFQTEDHPFASREFIEREHRRGRLVWCNAIVYNYLAVLSAGHNDDQALLEGPEGSWGWIADRGYDFMQTDWVAMARQWLEETGRLLRDRSGITAD